MDEKDAIQAEMDLLGDQAEVPAVEDDYEPRPRACDTAYCGKQENKSRGNWWFNAQSTIALISVVFSPGVIYRFPYMLYRHGPSYALCYTIMLFLFGLPLVYLEMTLGQFSSSGVLGCWPLPVFKGIGAGMLAFGIPSMYVFGVHGGWTLFYLHQTVQSSISGAPLPWESIPAAGPDCNDSLVLLNSHVRFVENCSELQDSDYYTKLKMKDGVCWSVTEDYYNYTYNKENLYPLAIYDLKAASEVFKGDLQDAPPPPQPDYYYDNEPASSPLANLLRKATPAEYFFNCRVLQFPKSLANPDALNTSMVVSSLVVWLLVILIASFGIRSIGLVTLVSVPLAFLILLALVFRGLTLPGAFEGLRFGFTGFRILGDYTVLLDSLRSVVFDTTVGCGIMITYSSYNRFHNNHVRDAVLVCVAAWILRLLAAFSVLGFAGYFSLMNDVALGDIMGAGHNIIFIMLPEIFSFLPLSKGWNGVLYMMALLMFIHSMVAFLETAMTALLDQLPRLRRFRLLLVIATGVVLFLLGLPMCSGSTLSWISMVDFALSGFTILVIVCLMLICYLVYGVMTYFWYRHDVAAMTGYHCCCCPSVVMWIFATFSLFGFLFISIVALFPLNIMEYFPAVRYIHDSIKPVPGWATWGFEVCIILFPYFIILLTLAIQLIVSAIWKKPTLRELFTKVWSPALPQHRSRVARYRSQNPYSTQNYSTMKHVERQMTATVQTDEQPPPYAEDGVELKSYTHRQDRV